MMKSAADIQQPFVPPQAQETKSTSVGSTQGTTVTVANAKPEVSRKSGVSIPGTGALKKAISKLNTIASYLKTGFIGFCCCTVPGTIAGGLGGAITGGVIGAATTGGIGILPMAIGLWHCWSHKRGIMCRWHRHSR